MVERKAEVSFDSLLRRARCREAEALDELFRRVRPRLKVLIRTRMGEGLRRCVDVEDVVQETLLTAFDSIETFAGRWEKAFYLWLAGIAERVLRRLSRYHRAQKRCVAREISLSDVLVVGRHKSAPHRHPLEDSGHSPHHIAAQKEHLQRLLEAVERLDRDRREVVVLARLKERPLAEIAEIMNRGRSACSMLLCRALRDLRAALAVRQRRGGAR